MTELSITTKVKLNNGVEMPVFGFGTFRINAGWATRDAVINALNVGYRHIDAAAIYGNEQNVGEAIVQSGIPREEIFLTTKLWNTHQGYDKALEGFETSLKKLKLTYVDLYLIHWPVQNLRLETWKTLEHLLSEKKCRAIGVSNYTIKHLEELMENSSTIPTVNQVEFSPYTYQKELLDFCKSHNIQLEAYSPLTKGQKLNDPKLVEIASKYSKTTPQILLRWALQKGVIVISKSSKKERIQNNTQVFDFEISQEDMALLDSFDEDLRTGWDPRDDNWA